MHDASCLPLGTGEAGVLHVILLSVARAEPGVGDDCVCDGALLGVPLGIDGLFAEVPRVDGIGVCSRAVRNEVSIAWKNEHENEKKSERDDVGGKCGRANI